MKVISKLKASAHYLNSPIVHLLLLPIVVLSHTVIIIDNPPVPHLLNEVLCASVVKLCTKLYESVTFVQL